MKIQIQNLSLRIQIHRLHHFKNLFLRHPIRPQPFFIHLLRHSPFSMNIHLPTKLQQIPRLPFQFLQTIPYTHTQIPQQQPILNPSRFLQIIPIHHLTHLSSYQSKLTSQNIIKVSRRNNPRIQSVKLLKKSFQ